MELKDFYVGKFVQVKETPDFKGYIDGIKLIHGKIYFLIRYFWSSPYPVEYDETYRGKYFYWEEIESLTEDI